MKIASIIISTYYRPPETSNYFPKNLNELFNESLLLTNATQNKLYFWEI